jgi:hypothetical protein
MRQKTRRFLRTRDKPPARPAESTADWVIENELGWGLPHAAIAAIAIFLVAVRVIGWELDRLEGWLERLRRPPAGGGPTT